MEERTTLRGRIASVADRIMPAELSAERYHKRQAIRPAIAAVIIGTIPLWAKIDRLGVLLTLGVAVMAAGVAAYHLWRARRAAPTERVVTRFEALPPTEQVKELQQLLVACTISLPLLSAWIAWDLYRLEAGTVGSVRIWAPIAMLYELLGFWPAVLAVPALGVWLFVFGRRRLRALTEAQSRQQAA